MRGGARRRRRTLLGRALICLAVAAGLGGCGGENYITPPNQVVENYLNALAAGYYPTACGMLDRRTREAQIRRAGPSATCEKLFARCLPHAVTRLSHDPTQLFYSNVEISGSGSKTSAAVGGTAVARAIKHVTLADENGKWKLTAYGDAVDQCRLVTHHRAGKGRTRASAARARARAGSS